MRQCFFIIKACKLSVVLFFIISIIWVFIFKWIVSRDFRGLQMIQWTEHKRLVLAVLQYIGYGYTRITKYFYFYKHFYQGDVSPSNVQKNTWILLKNWACHGWRDEYTIHMSGVCLLLSAPAAVKGSVTRFLPFFYFINRTHLGPW